MTKLMVFHHLPNPDDRPALERWFWRHHCPEVLAQAPWMSRYVLYRALPHPVGAERFAPINYRVHENWVFGPNERRGTRGLLSMTPEPAEMDVLALNVPAEPTDDFFGASLRAEETAFIRWVIVFRYPETVEEEEADAWYKHVHAPEVCRQPGLLRFFSHRVVPSQSSAIPKSEGQRPFVRKVSPWMAKKWHRVSELWYANDSAWRQAMIENPPQYTPPPWTSGGDYPFLKPWDEYISAFLPERPDEDLMRNCDWRYF